MKIRGLNFEDGYSPIDLPTGGWRYGRRFKIPKLLPRTRMRPAHLVNGTAGLLVFVAYIPDEPDSHPKHWSPGIHAKTILPCIDGGDLTAHPGRDKMVLTTFATCWAPLETNLYSIGDDQFGNPRQGGWNMNAFLVYESGANAPMDPITLGTGPIVLGSGPPADTIVPNPGGLISRSHLEIAFRDGDYLVTDLDSTNGTGIILQGSGHENEIGEHVTKLNHGDRIALAHVLTFRFHDPTQSTVKRRLGRRRKTRHLTFSEREPVVELSGAKVLLTQREFEVLKFMNSNLGEFCSKGSLMKAGWPQETHDRSGAERTDVEMIQVPGLNQSLQQLIRKIRQKMGVVPSHPYEIITMPKFGYKLENPSTE